MTDLERELEVLIAKWRTEAGEQGAIYASGIELCADELVAVMASASPQPESPSAATDDALKVLVDTELRASGFDPIVITNSELYADFYSVAMKAYRLGQLHSEDERK